MAKEDAVVKSTPVVSDAQLADIQSFDDAIQLVQDVFGGRLIDVSSEMGTGFRILENKDLLVGVPFIIIRVTENEGDYQDSFVSLTLVTQKNEKYVLNDGSTGIRAQVLDYFTRNPDRVGDPILVKSGLRKSEYYFNENTREVSNKPQPGFSPAATYYLDLSA